MTYRSVSGYTEITLKTYNLKDAIKYTTFIKNARKANYLSTGFT